MSSSEYPVTIATDSYSGGPPVLVVASSEAARTRAVDAVERAGYRTAAVPIEDGIPRLKQQVAASALWIEIDRDAGPSLDRLLDRIEAKSDESSLPTIVSTTAELLDPIAARIESPSIELLVDADPVDRVGALMLSIARTGPNERSMLHDVAREPSAARLRQLSDEVSRIAATLARLSVGPAASAEKLQPPKGTGPDISLDQVRQIIRARRLRARYFDEELFADPAWDMLLDLLQAEIAQHRVPVSSLCIASAVPATTALRWIKTMTDAGLFKRRADPHDGRRVFIELAPKASQALRGYFSEIGNLAVI